MAQPELLTSRLRLRPFSLADADRVQQLAGRREIAEGCVRIPHPYPPGLAARWIESQAEWWQTQQAVSFAVTALDSGLLLGSVTLVLTEQRQADQRIEWVGHLGYWLAPEFWGQGLMSEAVVVLLEFAFEELGVDRVVAEHTPQNPASGRVMAKSGLLFMHEYRSETSEHPPCQLRHYELSWPQYRQQHNLSSPLETKKNGP